MMMMMMMVVVRRDSNIWWLKFLSGCNNSACRGAHCVEWWEFPFGISWQHQWLWVVNVKACSRTLSGAIDFMSWYSILHWLSINHALNISNNIIYTFVLVSFTRINRSLFVRLFMCDRFLCFSERIIFIYECV